MNETMARSLSNKELAEEFRYHDDPGIAKLALAVIEHDPQASQEILEQADERAEIAEAKTEALRDLLRECIDELPESCKGLRERIDDEIA